MTRGPWKTYHPARGYYRRPEVVEKSKLVAKPHMMPGLTKEMLMGGRAPVAKSGARND